MRFAQIVSIIFTAFLLPSVAFAHGDPPKAKHGGLMQESQELWLELVVKDTEVRVYVLDEKQQPVAPAQVSGTATVLVSGTSYKVDLNSAASNAEGVEGKLPVPATGRLVATVALKIGAKSISARFMAP